MTTTGSEASVATAPKNDDPLPGLEPYAGHAAGGPTLRAYGRSREPQQLSVGGDEDEVLVAGPSSTAPTTRSPSSRRMTSKESRLLG